MIRGTFLVGAVVVVLAIGLADIVLSRILTDLRKSGSQSQPSYAINESKARGAYVASMLVTPNPIQWKGKSIIVKEAWLEHCTELVQEHVIIPYLLHRDEFRKTLGFHLCMNLSEESWDTLREERAFFVREGSGGGFGRRGTVVLWDDLASADFSTIKVRLTNSWRFENAVALELKRLLD